jgi:hypothetical protein
MTVCAILLRIACTLSPLALFLGCDQTLNLFRKQSIAPLQLTDLVLPGTGFGGLEFLKEIVVGCE